MWDFGGRGADTGDAAGGVVLVWSEDRCERITSLVCVEQGTEVVAQELKWAFQGISRQLVSRATDRVFGEGRR
jgi:hypothetical protein